MTVNFDLTSQDGRNAFLDKTLDIETYTDACRRAHEKSPQDLSIGTQFSSALRANGQFAEQMAVSEALLKDHPRDPRAHYSFALALMEAGRYRDAWPHFTARWALRKAPQKAQTLPQETRWMGQDRDIRDTLVLVGEQGLGDTIQYLRYALQVRESGLDIRLYLQPALRGLLAQNQAFRHMLFVDDEASIRQWCLLPDLLPMLAPTYQQVTYPGPYLSAPVESDPFVLSGNACSKIRVGLVWKGNPEHSGDRWRSMDLAQLLPLRTVETCQFYSLMLSSYSKEIQDAGAGDWIIDLSSRNGSFPELARALAAMDVVVSVDTSVAHLAGAMGKAVVLLVQFPPDWRWGNEPVETTRWYPSARVFRQEKFGDWSAPVEKARSFLSSL